MYSDVPPDRTMCFCVLSSPLFLLLSHSSLMARSMKSAKISNYLWYIAEIHG